MTAHSLSGKSSFVKPANGGDGFDGGLEQRMNTLETRLETILPTLATRSDMESLKTEIHRAVSESHRWMIGTAIGLFFGFGALFLATGNSLRPLAQNAQQPFIITLPASLNTVSAQPATSAFPAEKSKAAETGLK